MQKIGQTDSGYTIIALNICDESPMQDHKGGEIAVDEKSRCMYVHHIFVVTYGLDSVMKACNSYGVQS